MPFRPMLAVTVSRVCKDMFFFGNAKPLVALVLVLVHGSEFGDH